MRKLWEQKKTIHKVRWENYEKVDFWWFSKTIRNNYEKIFDRNFRKIRVPRYRSRHSCHSFCMKNLWENYEKTHVFAAKCQKIMRIPISCLFACPLVAIRLVSEANRKRREAIPKLPLESLGLWSGCVLHVNGVLGLVAFLVWENYEKPMRNLWESIRLKLFAN